MNTVDLRLINELRFLTNRSNLELIRGVVWIHGGRLRGGDRSNFLSMAMERNRASRRWHESYAFVSIDYRLAPETKVPLIIEDVEDAFAWIHREGPTLLKIDPNRIAAWGESAGAYLALMAGLRSKPQVVISFYGTGDRFGPKNNDPPQLPHQNISEAKARRQLGPPVTDARQRKGDVELFRLYCMQNGIWGKEIWGWDPVKEPEKDLPYTPLKNVSADYPPTLLLHGTEDTDITYDNSVRMAEALKAHGVKHEFISLSNVGHSFDRADRETIERAYDAVFKFLDSNLKK